MFKPNKGLFRRLGLSPLNKREAGQQFEDLACQYLKKQGLKLKKRNVAFSTGEIDLIMEDQNTLVFVEVRFRNKKEFGGAAASVDWYKQNKLIKTAQLYLQQQYGNTPPRCRFDVVAIQGTDDQFDINWIKNAIT
jgi:putative endonuclease